MSKDPQISIILPVYNDGDRVEGAIESVLQQSFDSIELLIVNDGSTDHTSDTLEEYDDHPQINIITHDENRGLPVALNTGLDYANGEYVMRQDSDDRSLPGRIRRQFKYHSNNPEIAVTTTGVEIIDEDDTVLYSMSGPENPAPDLQSQNSVIHGATMIRRDAITDVGGYDEFFRFCQDYDLWVRLYREGHQIRTIQEPLYQLRRDSETLSVDRRRKIALYGLLARAPPAQKQQLKDRAEKNGLESIYNGVSGEEKARYHQRMALANIENRNRIGAVRQALAGIKKNAFVPQSYAYLGVTLLPRSAADRVLNSVQGR